MAGSFYWIRVRSALRLIQPRRNFTIDEPPDAVGE
jgi:hypothetical protein